jgi:hypothetical protein
MCVTHLVIRATGELQVNVTWTVNAFYAGPARAPDTIFIAAHDTNSQDVYLVDADGRRYDQIQLEGAARDGGNGKVGESIWGYYLFPAATPNMRNFSLIVSDKNTAIPNLILGTPSP